MNNRLKILICPLEWGLGHAGRMIPLAKKLQELGHTIVIGSGDEHIALFKEELQDLQYIQFPGFKPGYSAFLPQYLYLLFQLPSLIFRTCSEHKRLNKIITDHNIDLVISDNRFGLWNKKIPAVYITHMPVIPFPRAFRFLERIGIVMHGWIIRKYSFCLIPDLPGDLNLTGRLSHGINLPPNVRYIGILSRFTDITDLSGADSYPSPRTTLVLSGPEPQRGILRDRIIYLLNNSSISTVILEGKPEQGIKISEEDRLYSYSHLGSAEMKKLIQGSDLVISRPGYTTIMELVSMNCSALLIPTPGQTEQEYLAGYLSSRGWFNTVTQKSLGKTTDLTSESLPDANEIVKESRILLAAAIGEILQDPDHNG